MRKILSVELNDENNFYAYVSELNDNETVEVDIYGWSHYYWEHGPECGASTQTMQISGKLEHKGWSQDLSGIKYVEEGI